MKASMPRRARTYSEVARLTGLERTSIYAAIGVGDLVARKFGHRTAVLASDLDKFLSNLPTAHIKNARGERQ